MVIASGCKSETPATKEAEKPTQTAPTGMPQGMDMGAGHGQGQALPQPKTTKEVVVSDDIKQRYPKVSLAITDKASGKTNNYPVTPNSEFKIPNSDLKVQVGAFIPDFTMTANQIISKSGDPNNPGLQVKIFEKEEQKYDGWLFANFPDMHAFEHDKFGVTLAKVEAK